MARPIKTGLDYFPLDCDLLNDEKVIAVKVSCGARGLAVVVALLCMIYRQGYCALWGEATALKVANDLPGVTPGFVGNVVEILVKYDFFDKGLFCAESVLTSAAIQRRWLSAKKYRFDTSTLRYWLIKDSKTGKLVLDAKTRVLDSKTPVLGVKNPTKKSKIKKISSDDDIKETTPSPPMQVEQEVELLNQDQIWIDNAQVSLSMDADTIRSHLQKFAVECRANGRDFHNSLSDCKSHFVSWINKRRYATTNTYRQPDARGDKGDKNRGRFSPPACGLHEG